MTQFRHGSPGTRPGGVAMKRCSPVISSARSAAPPRRNATTTRRPRCWPWRRRPRRSRTSPRPTVRSPQPSINGTPICGPARNTCESCISIDVRLWQRQGRLRGHQCFSWSWKCGGKPSGNINVRTEHGAVGGAVGVRLGARGTVHPRGLCTNGGARGGRGGAGDQGSPPHATAQLSVCPGGLRA
jgi:hypothetical protein